MAKRGSANRESPLAPLSKISTLTNDIHTPALSFKILLVPLVLHLNWSLVAPYFGLAGQANPFGKFFLLDGRVPSSPSDNPLYSKSYWDFAFIAYYVVFFSFVRQSITVNISTPIARYFGLRKEAKIDRFGEQNYAFWYFMVSGACGVVSQAYFSLTLWPHSYAIC